MRTCHRCWSPGASPSGTGEEGEGGPLLPLKEYKHRAERDYLARVLRSTAGNVAAAARLLDVSRTHLHERLVALDVPRPGDDRDDS